MLLQYGQLDAKTKIKRCVRKYILGQQIAPDDSIFWPTGLLAVGLWKCYISLGKCEVDEARGKSSLKSNSNHRKLAKDIESALSSYFDRWQRKGFPVFCLDDLLAGEVFLDIYLTGMEALDKTDYKNSRLFTKEKLKAYKKVIDKLAAYAFTHPTDRNGSFPYRSNWQEKHAYADTIGLACPFLYKYGVSFKKSEYTEMALRQIESFLSYGMDMQTGLPYHGYEAETGMKYGIIGWGRAVGWLLRGMQGCMTSAYGRERLESACHALMDKVLPYQKQDGLFSWQLQALDGPGDTSATGMICAALGDGIRSGVFTEEKYWHALAAGRAAIEAAAKDGLVYQCSGECEGFGRYPQIYGAYPWSLGPALLLFTEEKR